MASGLCPDSLAWSMSQLSIASLGLWLTVTIHQIFRDVTELMLGTSYPTLLWSMFVYATLMTHVHELESEARMLADPALFSMATAMYAKLRKYVDHSMSDSDYYYFAMGELHLLIQCYKMNLSLRGNCFLDSA
jgi:hypothetical protein